LRLWLAKYRLARNFKEFKVLDIKPYSSNVRLTLVVGERELDVAQITRDFLILRDRVSLDETVGTLIIVIDETVQRKVLIFPQGISAEAERISYW
jgi:hypothetical protein